MSRSYKKSPVVKDRNSGKYWKTQANRKVRKYSGDIPDGKQYRKIYCSYDIHDHIEWYSYREYKKDKESSILRVSQGVDKHDYRISEDRWAKFFYRK